jgi:hypothetical protein
MRTGEKNGSVDSFVSSSQTMIPSDMFIDSSTSVQSATVAWDSLTVSIEKFSDIGKPYRAGRESKIKRSVFDMIVRQSGASENGGANMRKQSRGSKHSSLLGVSGHANLLKVVPPASLLRPPRGNLICSTKDVSRELLALRRLPMTERTSAAARLIRTLDPSCPSHSDIALTVYLISTL